MRHRDVERKEWRKIGIALSASWIVVSSIVVASLIGLGLDRLLRTRGTLLVIMFVVGVGAGLYNLVRELRRME
ncbi:MAG: AtpZ/AtpI family protein [candidate division WOR-3 bacterium]